MQWLCQRLFWYPWEGFTYRVNKEELLQEDLTTNCFSKREIVLEGSPL